MYIAAITRCYPGPSPSGRGDRVPSRRSRSACAVWLNEELEIIRPELIIPVGRLAITRFLPNRPLDEIIGRGHDVEHAGGKSLAIPLPHPSGASSWIHQGDHPESARSRVATDRRELARLGIDRRTDAERGLMRGLVLLFTLHLGDDHPERRPLVQRGQGEAFCDGGVRADRCAFSGLRVVGVGRTGSLVGRDGRHVGGQCRKGDSGPARRRELQREGSDLGRRGSIGGQPPAPSYGTLSPGQALNRYIEGLARRLNRARPWARLSEVRRMKPRTKFLIGGALVLGVAGYLMASSINQTGVYYLTPTELSAKMKADPGFSNAGVKVGARVVAGSIKRDPGGRNTRSR